MGVFLRHRKPRPFALPLTDAFKRKNVFKNGTVCSAALFYGEMMEQLFQTEQNVWRQLKACKQPVVLYGMGDGADKVLAVFARFDIPVAGVMASDGFVRGQSFRGFTVKKESDLARELGSFTVALCFASQLPEVMDAVKAVAARRRLLVPPVPVCGDVLFDDDFIARYAGDMQAAYHLLADAWSRQVYRSVLRFYYTGDIALLDGVTTDKDEAFAHILRLGASEVYADVGAYDGDTVAEFLHYTGGSYRAIIALEPNAKNFAKLQAHCGNMPRTVLRQLGAWDSNTTLPFNNKAGRNSAVAAGGVATRVATLDSLLCDTDVTYIKADVEGADIQALRGMRQTLQRCRPKLNFAAYHRFEDVFRLPLRIHAYDPAYQIYLRHHPYIPAWDTNLYCV